MIEVRHVSKHYRRNAKERKQATDGDAWVRAVDDASFRCEPGKITTLLGPNGAGKTTLLRMAATLLAPTSGQIRICDLDTVREAAAARGQVGFLTGSAGLYDRLSGVETLRYFARLQGMTEEQFEARKDTVIEMLDIGDFAHRRVGKLSTGMKQRISIARTIVHDPAVIIFDEPTSGLDVLAAQGIVALIRRCKEEGKTVVFSTHRMDEVSLLSDHLVVIHQGRKIYDDTYQRFRDEADGRSPEENFIRLLEEAE